MKKGMTLIELMIVVAIIGILGAILLPRVGTILDSSREKTTLQNLSSLRLAISTYYGDWEEYPTSTAISSTPPGPMAEQEFTDMLVPEYLKEIPVCLLKRGLNNNEGTRTYFGGTPSPNTYPDHGGWRYYPGTGTIIINSAEHDTKGVLYSSY